jgi:hypothetical protein
MCGRCRPIRCAGHAQEQPSAATARSAGGHAAGVDTRGDHGRRAEDQGRLTPARPLRSPKAFARTRVCPQSAPGCRRVPLRCGSGARAAGEPACRPGSVHPRERGPAAIHLGLPLLTASCGLPASIGRAALNRSRSLPAVRTPRRIPSDLAPGGVYRAAAVTCGAGGLLHHRFTLTSGQDLSPAPRRSAFCGTFPRVTPGRRYRPPCPAEPGPSSPGR